MATTTQSRQDREQRARASKTDVNTGKPEGDKSHEQLHSKSAKKADTMLALPGRPAVNSRELYGESKSAKDERREAARERLKQNKERDKQREQQTQQAQEQQDEKPGRSRRGKSRRGKSSKGKSGKSSRGKSSKGSKRRGSARVKSRRSRSNPATQQQETAAAHSQE